MTQRTRPVLTASPAAALPRRAPSLLRRCSAALCLALALGLCLQPLDLAAAPVPGDGRRLTLASQIGGYTNAVAVQGQYAYLGVGPRLVVVSIADLTHPVMVGQTPMLPDIVSAVAPAGDYVYVAAGKAGLHVFSIANPAAPLEVGACPTLDVTYDVAVQGSYAYLADGRAGLRVVSVADPSSPLALGAYHGEDSWTFYTDVAVAGNIAFVIGSTLHIIDVSNPNAPSEIAEFQPYGLAQAVAVWGDYAYVTDEQFALNIVNIADPAAPLLVTRFVAFGQRSFVAAEGPYVYVGDRSHGLHIIDVTDPAAPAEVAGVETPYGLAAVAVAGPYLYLANQFSGLRVLNVAAPAVPVEVAAFSPPGAGLSLAVQGGYAYVSGGDRGLSIINVADSAHPYEVASYGAGWIGDAAVSGRYAYLVEHLHGLHILDISNPAVPRAAGYLAVPGARAIAVAGNHAYITRWSDGVDIIDVSDPAAPFVISHMNARLPPGAEHWGYTPSMERIVVDGTYAFILLDIPTGGTDFDLLQIIDVANPAAPATVAWFGGCTNEHMMGHLGGLAVSGSYAYVTFALGGLCIVDVADAAHPWVAGRHFVSPRQYETWAVAVSDGRAFVSLQSREWPELSDGLRVLNVADPATPHEDPFYATARTLGAFAVEGEYLYATAGDIGLLIYHLEPSAARLWFPVIH